jgi:gas vesicle protein
VSDKRGPGFLVGAAVGGLVGAGLAMLWGPRGREQARRKLEAWRAASRAEGEATGPANELLSLGLGVAQGALERIEQAVVAAGQAREEARARLSAEWEQCKRGA